MYNQKQCENSPTNTIILINLEDHDSETGFIRNSPMTSQKNLYVT